MISKKIRPIFTSNTDGGKQYCIVESVTWNFGTFQPADRIWRMRASAQIRPFIAQRTGSHPGAQRKPKVTVKAVWNVPFRSTRRPGWTVGENPFIPLHYKEKPVSKKLIKDTKSLLTGSEWNYHTQGLILLGSYSWACRSPPLRCMLSLAPRCLKQRKTRVNPVHQPFCQRPPDTLLVHRGPWFAGHFHQDGHQTCHCSILLSISES